MGSYPAATSRKPDLDKRVDPIIERCLKPDPADRYQKASELLADLEPLVSMVTMPPPTLTGWDKFVISAQRTGKTVGRVAGGILVTAAGVVLAVASARNSLPKPPPELPAAVFSTELPALDREAVPARVENLGLKHAVWIGSGPDQLTSLPEGRPLEVPTTDGVATLRVRTNFPDHPVGRVAIDVVEVDGQAARLDADVDVQPPHVDLRARWRKLVFGEAPSSRVALTLLGSPGRHATVMIGPPGTPVALEWVFGERRGVMLGPPSPPDASHLGLEVDLDGDLRAFVGKGADRRPVGEPVSLGKDWRKIFGRLPTPQLDCAEGDCEFSKVVYELEKEPPPPQPPPPPVAVVPPEPVEPVPPPPARPVRPGKHGLERAEKSERSGKKEEGKKVVSGKKSEKQPEKSAHRGREGR